MKKADPNPKANRNILKLVYVIVALFLGLIAYMAYFLQVRGEDVINNSYNARLDSFADRIIRGKILASDGTVLAETQIDGGRKRDPGLPLRQRILTTRWAIPPRVRPDIESLANFYPADKPRQFDGAGPKPDCPARKIWGIMCTPPWTRSSSRRPGMLWETSRGAVIAMEPDTGKILAMVSKPGYDPNTIAAGLGDPDQPRRTTRASC